MQIRPLGSFEDYRKVLALEQEIWGYTSADDAVPVPIMVVTQKIGGLLLGAYDERDGLVGFVYSLPGVRDGRPFQWSHMMGVVEGHRNRGVGWQLKIEQRRAALAAGFDLVEWTYDPLQAPNAHLNLVKLGALVREYHLDVYGPSSSPLHEGTPTDRFIAEWWLRSDRVASRLEAGGRGNSGCVEPHDAGPGPVGGHPTADAFAAAVAVNEIDPRGDWVAPGAANLSLDADGLVVAIPTGFTDLQRTDGGLARAWRAATREIFTSYLPRGYEVCDFRVDRARRLGLYLLERRAFGRL
jgi:predicted GNAT superfamily acetyltransferase